MRLALAQLNFTVGAFEANFERMRAALTRAREAGAELVVFSEMAATGYPPRDLLTHAGFVQANVALVERVAALTDDRLGAIVGFVDPNPSREGKGLFNAAAVCLGGRIIARRYKSLLPTYDVFDEDRYFEPAREVAPVDFKGLRLGITICEDVWNAKDFWPSRLYHRDPVDEVVRAGADLLINISSSPFSLGKPAVRREMIRQDAMKYGRYFFYLNQVGGNDELVFDGHSLGFDPNGDVVLRARDFDEDFLVYDVPVGPGAAAAGSPGVMADVSGSRVEEAYKALELGLRDYVRKCGFTDVVVGLSGGIDSALTATLAACAIGPQHVLGVSMPTRYSSDHSRRDAEALAHNLGIPYRQIPVDGVFGAYLATLAPVFEGYREDVTEENIQARIRGAVLMALANKFGSLVLSTGNKSELAVGYCTLYGDMAGGLAVISDVPKTLVYELARFINRDGTRIPESTITKPPSAELKPGQTDQDTLPPYDVLDRILEAYVERNLDVDGICGLGLDAALVQKVVNMIDRAEYKRRQAAPGLKITSKAFGVGRRYPIAADYRAVMRARAVQLA
ncbi:MAG TPA: NAD+ synthase [Vicinamibacterales bacterium]|nr:NAD+ synthase [Vicinamibacterales bacterium]